jgi:hypothetical protein
MSQIDTRYTVAGHIESTNTTLLDAIQSALPAEGDVVLGDEYSVSRTDVDDSNAERLSARMTFAPDDDEFAISDGTTKHVVELDADEEIVTTDADEEIVTTDDGERVVKTDFGEIPVDSYGRANEVLRSEVTDIFGPKTAAMNLYQEVANADLAGKADNWELQVYESPQGGVLASDVKEWYEEDESRQPTRTDEDGNEVKYVPSSFDPQNHVIQQTSG